MHDFFDQIKKMKILIFENDKKTTFKFKIFGTGGCRGRYADSIERNQSTLASKLEN